MNKLKLALLLVILCLGTAYSQVKVTFIQLNDVYEITPLENGRFGGMARVATLVKQYKLRDPNTFAVLSGDFISPSALGTGEYNGKRINGAQMIDAMNLAGIDYVTFGNHEFDVKEELLQSRMNESHFKWFSSNVKRVFQRAELPYTQLIDSVSVPIPEYEIIRVKDESGYDVKIGMISVTVNNNKAAWVSYGDYYTSARNAYNMIKDSTDFVIAMTHISIDEDKELARQVPELKLIMGGHEHTNMKFITGNTVITKADANAKTVYIHTLDIGKDHKNVSISSELKTIDASISEDADTKANVNIWVERAYAGFRAKGLEPEEKVVQISDSLNGLETSIRFKPTNLSDIIASSMLAASDKADLSIFNSGSIRIDDKLTGTITQYDIIRTLPFGGKILEVKMKGSLIKKILEASEKNKGSGGYLQTANVSFKNKNWYIGKKKIIDTRIYKTAIADFLLTGLEKNLDFLTSKNPEITEIKEPDKNNKNDLRNDIRLAVISYLKNHYNPKQKLKNK
jgi:2',3'-cyclic-nucleotide 2'-phosphodiesterase (5'-nucleotidase family)